MNRPADAAPLRIPELGPSLGRLVVSPPRPTGIPAPWIPLADIRQDLVTAIFDRAGEAREWSAADDWDLALAALSRANWRSMWDTAVQATASRAAGDLEARLRAAAAEARLPKRRAARLTIGDAETRALAVRLATGAGPFLDALDALDEAQHALRAAGPGDPLALEAWQRALTTTARRLEAAWLALEAALTDEWDSWHGVIESVRAWRRPRWPLWVIGAALLALCTWLGLVVGGYIDSPSWFLPAAEWLWERL